MILSQIRDKMSEVTCPHCSTNSEWSINLQCGLYTRDCVVHAHCPNCQADFTVAVMYGMPLDQTISGKTIECDPNSNVCEFIEDKKATAA